MEIINFQDKRWLVHYKVNDEGFNTTLLELMKEYRGAEMILKKDGIFYFVSEISDAQFST